MEGNEFLTSDKLGIKTDDHAFLARFDANLAVEPRHVLPKRKSWTAAAVAELVGLAAAGALAFTTVLPAGRAFLGVAQHELVHRASAYGISSSLALLLVVGLGFAGAFAWPRLRAEVF